MGQLIAHEINESEDAKLVLCICRDESSLCGQSADQVTHNPANKNVKITAGAKANYADVNVMIDFSVPEAVPVHVEAAASHGFGLVLGTTGLNEEHYARITKASASTPVLVASNTSIGVHLLNRLIATASQALEDSFDVEVLEAHHGNKTDAPSGTALELGRTIAKARGLDLDKCAKYGRSPLTPGRRQKGEIGFSAIRGGDIYGEHTVMFISDEERIEISHRATKRSLFAHGALRAARFVNSASPGLYGMDDVLGGNL